MKLSLQEVDAIIAALQLINTKNQDLQEQLLGVQYSEIYKKLENHRFNLTNM